MQEANLTYNSQPLVYNGNYITFLTDSSSVTEGEIISGGDLNGGIVAEENQVSSNPLTDPFIKDEYREIANLQKFALNRQKVAPLLSRLLKKLFDRAYLAFINYFDFDSSSQTTFTQANQFKKLITSTSSAYDWESFSHSNNRVTNYEYTKNVKLEGIVSIAGNNNEEVHAAFFKNDEIVPCSEQSAVTTSGGKAPNIAIQCITTMNPNDYVEVWVKNSTSNHPVTLHSINVIVTEL